jgi:hypothetical protein
MNIEENIRKVLREEVSFMDKIRNLFTKKQPTPEDKLLDIIVEFIESNFDIIETQARGEFLYRLDGNLVMTYNKKFKRLDYRWDLAKTIHDYIPDDRLLHLDSELMGKVFTKLFNKPVIAALGYSMMG